VGAGASHPALAVEPDLAAEVMQSFLGVRRASLDVLLRHLDTLMERASSLRTRGTASAQDSLHPATLTSILHQHGEHSARALRSLLDSHVHLYTLVLPRVAQESIGGWAGTSRQQAVAHFRALGAAVNMQRRLVAAVSSTPQDSPELEALVAQVVRGRVTGLVVARDAWGVSLGHWRAILIINAGLTLMQDLAMGNLIAG
jgi:hypothetical protein